jgi:hypothetical protein
MRTTLLAGIVLLLSLGTLYAGGQLEITGVPQAVQVEYPSTGESVVTVSFTLTNSGGFTFYEVGVTAGGTGDPEDRRLSGPAGEELPYRVTTIGGGQDLKDRPDNPTSEEILSGSLARGESASLSFEVRLAGGDSLTAGLYSDTLSLVAWDFNYGSWSVSNEKSFGINLPVPSRVDLSLVPVGGAFDPRADAYTLDFGFLEAGDTGALDLMVKGNVGYTLSLSSMNGGVLSHADPLDGSAISYDLSADGQLVGLGTGSTAVADSLSPPGPDGDRYNLVFEVGEIGDASSGEYRDVVQVVVTAR